MKMSKNPNPSQFQIHVVHELKELIGKLKMLNPPGIVLMLIVLGILAYVIWTFFLSYQMS